MKKSFGKILATVCLVMFFSTSASAVIILPDPEIQFVTRTYDDFYSYSFGVLDYFYGDTYAYPGPSAGTGTLNGILWTDNNGNVKSFPFYDAFREPSNEPVVEGTAWAFVSDVVEYLKDTGSFTPVFLYDLNQEGSNSNVYVSSLMYVTDVDNQVVRSWSLDNTEDGFFDKSDYVNATGKIDITEGTTVTSNIGGGAFDYLVYAKDMDLSVWDLEGYKFHVDVYFSGLNNGGETIVMTNLYAPYRDNTPVPEPSTMLLLGAGLLGLGAVARRRRAN